jgi:hypothetical protein
VRPFDNLAAEGNELQGVMPWRGRNMSGVEGDNILQIKNNASQMIDNQVLRIKGAVKGN